MPGCPAMKERHVSTPVGNATLKIGVYSVVTAAVVGIGSLGYFGMGLSSEPSALVNLNSRTWNEEIKEKIQSCYMYLFFSFYICVVTACIVFSSPMLLRIFSSFPMIVIDFLVQTSMQGGKALIQFNSQGVFNTQRMIWVMYCMFLGGIASPVFFMGVNTTRISVHLTTIIVSALVMLSFVAPVGKFAKLKTKLTTTEVGVFVSSIGASLFPITTTLGAIFFTISFHGGLILYPLSFLCHSQEAQLQAAAEDPYCSVAMSVPMLLDVISIFGRVVILVPPS